MKRWVIIIIIGLLGLTACTTFNGVTVISPKPGGPYNPGKVDNLQPTLEWKSSSKGEETYDVIIFETSWVKNDNLFPHNICELFQRHGEMVYYRERIKETYHKVEDTLEPDEEYFWSVRVREGDKVSEWSRYDYFLFGVVAYIQGNNLWFYFKTPKSK